MATGSATSDGRTLRDRLPSVRRVGRTVLSALVSAPGRSTATLLLAVPYAWLGYYVVGTALGRHGDVVGTALGRHGDVIASGDWLTLVFTSYAFISSVALAHRTLEVGTDGLTVESLLDVVILVWLTAFYFVWMLVREPVSTTTAVAELYEPVLDGEPTAVLWTVTIVAVGLLAAGIILFPRRESRPFGRRFRTAFVTFPVGITAVVLLVRPGGDSLLWPVVIGVFLGTLLSGVVRVHVIVSAIARGIFAGLSLFVWTAGAIGWVLVYRRRPPTDAVALATAPGRPKEGRSDGEGEQS